MSFFRTLIIWILAFSLPVEAVASVSMSQCKDMQMSMSVPLRPGANPMHHDMSAKDHAAMMGASVGADSNVSSLHKHHSMAKADGSSDTAKSLGCKCGCKCSGNCAVSCAAMLGTLAAHQPPGFISDSSLLFVAGPRGQAHAAYRFDPLRPPSTVAS